MREGVATWKSRHSVPETVVRLQALLQERGIKIFCMIDFAADALAAGLEMRPTQLLIFGDPRAGTPVMLAAPSAALDLPLRLLVAEAEDGNVHLSWNEPGWLQQRHGFAEQLTANISAIATLARLAAD